MTLRVYRSLSSAVVPFAPALIKRRLRLGKEDRNGSPNGAGSRATSGRSAVWSGFTAPSVGEVLAAAALIERLRALNLRVLLTSGTVTSAAIVAKRFPPMSSTNTCLTIRRAS